ncbi:MAG: hypothetical protein OEZ36_12060 [Spirochaetota bacterium]|nr:hypothetical protein [Spirochaetota bacterium]
MSDIFKAGDFFFTGGHGPLSRLIRYFSKSIGEKRTVVNHVGIVLAEGDLKNCVVVEALSTVKKHRLIDRYGGRKDKLLY